MTGARLFGYWACVALTIALALSIKDTVSAHCSAAELRGESPQLPSFTGFLRVFWLGWPLHLLLVGTLLLPGGVAAIVTRLTAPSRIGTFPQWGGLGLLVCLLLLTIYTNIREFDCASSIFDTGFESATLTAGLLLAILATALLLVFALFSWIVTYFLERRG